MIFPEIFDSIYAVGAAGYWLENGAYAENERTRLLLLSLDSTGKMRANLKAMAQLNEGLRFRELHTHTEAQLSA